MYQAIQLTIIALAGISVYIGLERILPLFQGRKKAKSRLRYKREKRWSYSLGKQLEYSTPFYRHINDILTALDKNISFSFFLFSTLVLAALAWVLGQTVLQSYLFSMLLTLILGSIPYLSLRWMLSSFHGKVHKELLSAVEAFIQSYHIVPNGNMRLALSTTLPHLRYPIRYAFEQLLMMIDSQEDDQDIQRIFRMRLGNAFADEWIIIFFQGLRSGVDMSEYLEELLEDMRESENEFHQDRVRNVEIRFGNGFAVLAFGYFSYLNYTTRDDFISFYFHGEGKMVTLGTIMTLFFINLIGMYISGRKRH